MNIVEFALKFKDMASGQLQKFGSSSRQVLNNAGKLTNQLTGNNRVLGKSYNELQKRMRELESTIQNSTVVKQIRDARRELTMLQKQANKHPAGSGMAGKGGSGGGLLGMMGGTRAFVGIGTAIAAGRFLGSAVADNFERQRVQTSFNVLAGSDESGQALTKQLVALQKNTVLGSEVFKNAQTMMGFGFASTDVIDNLRMLGDVAMGDKQRLDSLTLAFSQIRAGGKLTGQDLLQMINAGFNPLEQMSRTTGKSMAVLRDEMSKGNISFEMVQQAFKDATGEGGKFNNMLGRIAETPAGKMAQLSGAWNEFKINAGGALMPLVNFALDLANKVLPIIEGIIQPLSEGVQMVVGWIQTAVSETGGWADYINIIREYLMEGVVPLFKTVFRTVADMVKQLMQFIKQSELLKGIFKFIADVCRFIMEVIRALVEAVKWIFDNIIMPILKAIEKVYRFLTGKKQLKISGEQGADGSVTLKTPEFDRKASETNNNLLTDIAKNTKENNAAASSMASTVSGGGPKVVNITVQKFLDSMNFYTTNMPENESEAENAMLQMFGRVLAQGAATS